VRPDPKRPEALLTILLAPDGLADARLYHNGVAIGAGLEASAAPDAVAPPARVTVPVQLVKGRNRFYAMASYRGADRTFDSRSPEVEVDYAGSAEPGRLHVLALGVGDYARRRLKFAEHDAQRISEILHDRGLEVAGKRGLRLVRTNADVSVEGVSADFRALAREARPEDTVVVFLAGHTGVFEAGQFCLLLPSFPFPAESPALAMARGAVVARDGVGGTVDPRHVMPYAVIEANLMRLKALNRLVIVDACQAESIFDDARVKEIRKWMEVRSRRARTSYLMAARRGEPALEFTGLGHGLFTYTLLRGMGGGAVDRATEPREVARIAPRDDADFNNDGVITTGELDQYARRTLPGFARVFPGLMARGENAAPANRAGQPPVDEAQLGQGLQMQAASLSFELIPLPKPAPR
jgi:Caspase domain